MAIARPTLIAPDSSHWAKWFDAMRSSNPMRRQRALDLHGELLDRSRVPLLSWHHLEELLGHEDEARVRDRIASLKALPLLSWLRLPQYDVGLGSIAQILAAEAVAATEGASDLHSIRDRARTILLRTGTGRQAIGEHDWVWDAVRPALDEHRGHSAMVAAFGPMRAFDDSKTIGELSKGSLASPEEIRAKLPCIYAQTFQQALRGTDGDEIRARAMTDEFMRRMIAMMPPPGTTVRGLLVRSLVERGVDENEVRDECVLADLERLAVFRSQLRIIASETGRSFAALKQVPMDILPSRVIEDALRVHGQPREKLPASDVNDGHLAVLAAYCDVLYVDKRTAEDFRIARQKDNRLDGLIGEVAKAADFDALLGDQSLMHEDVIGNAADRP